MKKLICAALILALLPVTAFAAEDSAAAAEKLGRYGIMTGGADGELRLGDSLTRAEAAKLLCAAGRFVNETETDIPDVPKEHWARPYVLAAIGHGLMELREDGNFSPEADVSNEEMVKMLVILLGWREGAEQHGGFPAGYTSIAAILGITQGLKLKPGAAATRGDAAVMLANALDVPVEVAEFDAEQNIMTLAPSETLREILKNRAGV